MASSVIEEVSNESELTLVQQFERVIDQGLEAFNKKALELQNSSPTFRDGSVSLEQASAQGDPAKNPALQPSVSAVFGEPLPYYLKKTTDAEAKTMLRDGRKLAGMSAQLPVSEHMRFLRILGEEIQAVAEEMEASILMETGKPDALCKVETAKGLKWLAHAFKNAETQIDGLRPMGVTQVIESFNYPFAIAMAGIVGALASGNSLIIAGADKASAWLYHFMDAAKKAIDRFHLDENLVGKEFAENYDGLKHALVQFNIGITPRITRNANVVHFVGSEATGKKIKELRGNKRTIIEMGGPNTITVMADAIQDDEAQKFIDMIYAKVAPGAGQSCSSTRRVLVERGPAGRAFIEGLKKKFENTDHHIGNPAGQTTMMGPVVDRNSFNGMRSIQEFAAEAGFYCSGMEVDPEVVPMAAHPNAQYAKPMLTVLDPPLPDQELFNKACKITQTEYFGPEVQVIEVDDLDQAIAWARFIDPESRLTGAIITKNIDHAKKYEQAVKVTNFGHNKIPSDASPDGEHGHPDMPFKVGGEHHYPQYCSDKKRTVVQPEEFALEVA